METLAKQWGSGAAWKGTHLAPFEKDERDDSAHRAEARADDGHACELLGQMVWYGMVWYGMVWYGVCMRVGHKGSTKHTGGHRPIRDRHALQLITAFLLPPQGPY